MCGITSSGRIYKLKGGPGLNGDAAYVLQRWRVINGVETLKDISDEVLAENKQAS